VILSEAECLLWDREAIAADLAADPTSWDYPAETLAYVDASIEDANAELARRERLSVRPGAPPWPASWPDRRPDLAAIKSAIDLPRFIEEMYPGTRLKRQGKHLVTHCMLPGHDAKTPSFTGHPEKQLWYCHGCHRGGDVFTLTTHALGITDFGEIVKVLTDAAGLGVQHG